MEDLRIAAVCMNAVPGEVERNLDRIESFVFKAAEQDAKFVCFPELSVTGYTIKDPAGIYGGMDRDKILERLRLMASASGLVIIAGMIESSENADPFISQVAVGPGKVIGIYQKSHLSNPEKKVYAPGDQLSVFSHENTTFGIQLCYEAHFPEISTIMALMGAEILFFPHASPRGDANKKLKSWLRHLPARAFDNGVFVVACNQVGETGEGYVFPGVAFVLGPDGQILSSYAGEKETILYADIKARTLEEVRKHRMKYFLPERRPELYKMLLKEWPK